MRASVQFVSEPIEETLQSCLERINQLEGQIICSTKIQLQEQIISSRVSHGYKYKMALFDEALPIPLLYMR
jgi:hypothetical protein